TCSPVAAPDGAGVADIAAGAGAGGGGGAAAGAAAGGGGAGLGAAGTAACAFAGVSGGKSNALNCPVRRLNSARSSIFATMCHLLLLIMARTTNAPSFVM